MRPSTGQPQAEASGHSGTCSPPSNRPVFLSLPLDDWAAPALGPAVVRSASARIGPDPARVRRLAAAIAGAKRQVLIFGATVARASGWDQAVALAEKIDAPVWAAPSSERAPFPKDHPLYQGGLPFAIGPLAQHLDGYDLAVVVGAPVFRYYPYIPGDYLPDRLRLWLSPMIPRRPDAPRSATASSATGSDHRTAAAAGAPRRPHATAEASAAAPDVPLRSGPAPAG